jgi:hypothetical protein
MTDRLTVPADDNIALLHARLGSWSLRFDLHHHDASSTAFDGDKLKAEAKVAPRDMSILLKPRRDALDGSRRNDKDAAARSIHRHAKSPTGCVNGKTTFGTPAHAQIKLDPRVDLATP